MAMIGCCAVDFSLLTCCYPCKSRGGGGVSQLPLSTACSCPIYDRRILSQVSPASLPALQGMMLEGAIRWELLRPRGTTGW